MAAKRLAAARRKKLRVNSLAFSNANASSALVCSRNAIPADLTKPTLDVKIITSEISATATATPVAHSDSANRILSNECNVLLHDPLTEAMLKVNALENQVKSLKNDIVTINETLAKVMPLVHLTSIQNHTKPSDLSEAGKLLDAIAYETNERARRACNAILFNVPDRLLLSNLMRSLLNFCKMPQDCCTASRLRKTRGRTCPVLIKFTGHELAKRFVAASFILKQQAQLGSLVIREDLTPLQRATLRAKPPPSNKKARSAPRNVTPNTRGAVDLDSSDSHPNHGFPPIETLLETGLYRDTTVNAAVTTVTHRDNVECDTSKELPHCVSIMRDSDTEPAVLSVVSPATTTITCEHDNLHTLFGVPHGPCDSGQNYRTPTPPANPSKIRRMNETRARNNMAANSQSNQIANTNPWTQGRQPLPIQPSAPVHRPTLGFVDTAGHSHPLNYNLRSPGRNNRKPTPAANQTTIRQTNDTRTRNPLIVKPQEHWTARINPRSQARQSVPPQLSPTTCRPSLDSMNTARSGHSQRNSQSTPAPNYLTRTPLANLTMNRRTNGTKTRNHFVANQQEHRITHTNPWILEMQPEPAQLTPIYRPSLGFPDAASHSQLQRNSCLLETPSIAVFTPTYQQSRDTQGLLPPGRGRSSYGNVQWPSSSQAAHPTPPINHFHYFRQSQPAISANMTAHNSDPLTAAPFLWNTAGYGPPRPPYHAQADALLHLRTLLNTMHLSPNGWFQPSD